MKKLLTIATLTVLTATAALATEDNLGLFDKKCGTISARVQVLGMYRDYDDGNNLHSTTLGLQLGYTTPQILGFQAGFVYNGAGVLDSTDYNTTANPGEALLANGRINVLNQAYLQYNFADLNASNTIVQIGRRVNNGEIFRTDEVRQKPRSLEGVAIETKDIPNTRIMIGHTWKEANIWSTETHGSLSSWDFQDYGEVFNKNYDTHGVTFAEGSYTGIKGLELVLFDAYAFDVVNLIGTRAKYDITEKTAIAGHYRNETSVGKANDTVSECYGISAIQKVGSVTLEGGYFGVSGANLQFQEATTGFNHALGSSLMILTRHFDGGSDTLYLKAVTKINKTTLYGLFNATWHDRVLFDGQELDLVVKQQINDNLSVALKGGIGMLQVDTGDHIMATDGRVFLTYTF